MSMPASGFPLDTKPQKEKELSELILSRKAGLEALERSFQEFAREVERTRQLVAKLSDEMRSPIVR